MAHLVLPFPEALAVASSQKPFPPQVKRVSSQGDTIVLELNAEASLPKLLRRISPTITALLQYQDFQGGVLSFKVTAKFLSLSTDALVKLLLSILKLPEREGIKLELLDSPTGKVAILNIDLQHLINRKVRGVTVEGCKLQDDAIHMDASIQQLTVLERAEA